MEIFLAFLGSPWLLGTELGCLYGNLWNKLCLVFMRPVMGKKFGSKK